VQSVIQDDKRAAIATVIECQPNHSATPAREGYRFKKLAFEKVASIV
jgi:hypothetical protein